MLFVSHDLAVVKHLADRIIVLYQGDRRAGHRRQPVYESAGALHPAAAQRHTRALND
jgi:ABC-type glutathione transport system ATPase component